MSAQNEIPPPLESPERNWLCCTTYKDRVRFQAMLATMDLSMHQKQIIQTRYISVLENFQRRNRNHGIVFFVGHFIITVGSLFVPALLSIQNSDKGYVFGNSNFTVHVYWATFVLSLLVTIFNGILTLFKIDKKYYFLNTTLERLRSEGWQYVSLTGRYSGHLLGADIEPNHQNQFVFFMHHVEKIKMKQVEEEYYKTDEKSGQSANVAQNGANSTHPARSELLPISPVKPIADIQQSSPEPLKDAMNSILIAQKSMPAAPPVLNNGSSLMSPFQVNPLASSSTTAAATAAAESSILIDETGGLGLFAPRKISVTANEEETKDPMNK